MKYTDEDWQRAFNWLESHRPKEETLAQLIADVRRERTERAERGIEELVSEMLVLRERLDKTEAERDKALRDARSLARWLVELGETVDPDPEKP